MLYRRHAFLIASIRLHFWLTCDFSVEVNLLYFPRFSYYFNLRYLPQSCNLLNDHNGCSVQFNLHRFIDKIIIVFYNYLLKIRIIIRCLKTKTVYKFTKLVGNLIPCHFYPIFYSDFFVRSIRDFESVPLKFLTNSCSKEILRIFRFFNGEINVRT